MDIPQCVYSFTIGWTFGLLPVLQGITEVKSHLGRMNEEMIIIPTGPGALGWWSSRGTVIPSYSWHLPSACPCAAQALGEAVNTSTAVDPSQHCRGTFLLLGPPAHHTLHPPPPAHSSFPQSLTHFPRLQISYLWPSYEALNFPFILFMFRPHCLAWKSFPLFSASSLGTLHPPTLLINTWQSARCWPRKRQTGRCHRIDSLIQT